MVKQASKVSKEKEYYIVNPSGAVHCVTYNHAKNRLKDPRYRAATKEEVKRYKDNKHQTWDNPFGKPWRSEIEAFEEPEAIGDIKDEN